MKISIFGLGYVGAVSAGCLSAAGHELVGVDPVPLKAELINSGKSPIIEKDLAGLIAHAVAAGRLRAICDGYEAVQQSDLSFICVGTPSKPNGDLDIGNIATVCREIGEAIGMKSAPHTVVVRSTVLPGTTRGLVIPLLEKCSGKRAGVDFGVASNPEFLREGTAVHDFAHPPKTVIGALTTETANLLTALYEGLPAPLIRTSIEVAEMVKYCDNAWHALKVVYANEIGSICKAEGVDSHAVMDIFCQDTKLNLSASYLKPGFAFGGSCLPKDVRALTYKAKSRDLEVPVLNSILPSNSHQISRAFELVVGRENRRVAVLGLSFKEGTDDLRESPVLELVERLIGKGYAIRIFDKYVSLAKLVGANRDFLLRAIPHVSSLLVGRLEEALEFGDTIIVGTRDRDFLQIGERLKPGQSLVDLARIESFENLKERYDGINW